MVNKAPQGMAYKEARAWYKENTDTFRLAEFNRFWNEYKEAKDDDAKNTLNDRAADAVDMRAQDQENKREDLPAESGAVKMGEQDGGIAADYGQDLEPIDDGTDITESTQSRETAPQIGQNYQEMAYHLADSVHQVLANLVNYMTRGKVKVQKEGVHRLNICGVELIKKYDKDGTLFEFGPELAYVLTLADIGTQVYAELRMQNNQQEPKNE